MTTSVHSKQHIRIAYKPRPTKGTTCFSRVARVMTYLAVGTKSLITLSCLSVTLHTLLFRAAYDWDSVLDMSVAANI